MLLCALPPLQVAVTVATVLLLTVCAEQLMVTRSLPVGTVYTPGVPPNVAEKTTTLLLLLRLTSWGLVTVLSRMTSHVKLWPPWMLVMGLPPPDGLEVYIVR